MATNLGHTMAENWVTGEYRWIRKSTNKEPTLFQEKVLQGLKAHLEGSASSTEEAMDISSQVCREQNPEDAWHDFLGSFLSAAMATSESGPLKSLVQLLNCISIQPDALNMSGGIVTVDSKTARPRQIQDGERIEIAGVRLFSGLPQFCMQVREIWNGPNGLIHRWGSQKTATDAWTNINAFLAHVCLYNEAHQGAIPAAWATNFGLWTITDGLENAGGVQDHACAAAQWLLILGPIIRADETWGGRDGMVEHGPQREGALWHAERLQGASQVDRWAFWQRRLVDISGAAESDARTRQACAEAAALLQRD